MAITVKHSKVSTIPDTTDTSLVRPSDWNADHTLVGTIDVPNGGTGASTLTGYVKGNGTSAMTASATIPSGDVTGLGTMSTQNANAVAITGGTINGTTIGATSATTVNATTLSGQTGVLRGTGQNLSLQSQTFENASWVKNNLTVSANTTETTAPDGTSTADIYDDGTSSALHYLAQNITVILGGTYTYSVYAKKKSLNFINVGITDIAVGDRFAVASFNINTGAVSSSLANGTGYLIVSTSITSAGNSWFRCVITFVVGTTASAPRFILASSTDGTVSAGSGGIQTYLGANNQTYIWGSQVELSTTANTYIPTTTTAVYGTPTLSFSGVSTLGLESNGTLFLQPAGTGAIQAQATTSTTAGGNVRGANAVDWQTTRGSAANVASGSQSVVGGGINNTASNFYSSVLGGANNTASGNASFVGGGNSNTAGARDWSAVVGGYLNSANGFYNFVGGGWTNSGTASAAVTTQSATMNATTAVTLSGSNANIKVGQYVSGTSIAADTYVAAISGTALTLSKVASGSSTSTLSFFTPHGVVVGGGNNQATGAYSAILGGGDAGTAANRNVASGDWSFVGGGFKNVSSANQSVVLGGDNNTASGSNSTVLGGTTNTASGVGSSVLGGYNNIANATLATVVGARAGTTRSISGNTVFPASNYPIGVVTGIQSALLILARQTTDATATALASDTSAAGTTNQVILPNNSAYFFRGEVVSGVTGGGNTKGWTIEGVIKRGANAASTALVGTPTVTSSFADAGASTWAIAVTADTTNGGIRVTFTGQASTTIRTVCQIRTTEMTY